MQKDKLLNIPLKNTKPLSDKQFNASKESKDCSLIKENSDNWLNSKETALYLKISIKTLFNLTSNGRIPFYKFGRRNRYKLDDLRNLLSSQPRGGYKWD